MEERPSEPVIFIARSRTFDYGATLTCARVSVSMSGFPWGWGAPPAPPGLYSQQKHQVRSAVGGRISEPFAALRMMWLRQSPLFQASNPPFDQRGSAIGYYQQSSRPEGQTMAYYVPVSASPRVRQDRPLRQTCSLRLGALRLLPPANGPRASPCPPAA